MTRFTLFVLPFPLLLVFAACLPEDDTIDRGAIYLDVQSPQLVQPVPANFPQYEITFDRFTIITSGDVLDCHALYYVERPRPPVAIVDLTRPYTFQHRSLKENECRAVVGAINFSKTTDPYATDGVTEEDTRLLMPGGIGTVGNVHLVATLRYPRERIAGSPSLASFQRRFDIVIPASTGYAITPTAVKVPHGDKADIRFRYDLGPLATTLAYEALFWDTDHDGTITTDELPQTTKDSLKRAASDRWLY